MLRDPRVYQVKHVVCLLNQKPMSLRKKLSTTESSYTFASSIINRAVGLGWTVSFLKTIRIQLKQSVSTIGGQQCDESNDNT